MTTVYATTEGTGGTDVIPFEPVHARYVRMNGVKRATPYGYSIYELGVYGHTKADAELTDLHFIALTLEDAEGNVVSENFYWRNGVEDLNYTALNELPKAAVSVEVLDASVVEDTGTVELVLTNKSETVAFGNRIRLVHADTKARVLPVMMPENYITLMPGETRRLVMEADAAQLEGGVDVLIKQYAHQEESLATVRW